MHNNRYPNTVYQRRTQWKFGGAIPHKSWQATTKVLDREKAFADAEGFGKWAIGGGKIGGAFTGNIVEVTNTDDYAPGSAEIQGSLRWALSSKDNSGPKIIQFSSNLQGDGTIELKDTLVIDEPFVTIDGQTAPGDGICLRDYGVSIRTDHVIIRYIRCRPGDTTQATYALGDGRNDHDCFTVGDDHFSARHVILDHCSASWAIDETISIGDRDNDTDNVTIQWCILNNGLRKSIHSKTKKTGLLHGYGSLFHASRGAKYSIHHCMYAHITKRSPRLSNKWNPSFGTSGGDPVGGYIDFRNNLLYNWGNVGGKKAAGKNFDANKLFFSKIHYNFVGNYYQRGPDTAPNGDLVILEHTKTARGFYSGNWMNGVLAPLQSPGAGLPANGQWSLVGLVNLGGAKGFSAAEQGLYKNESELFVSDASGTPGGIGGIAYGFPATQAADSAKNDIISFTFGAGASQSRDPVDAEAVGSFETGIGSIIDSQKEFAGEWPHLQL